MLRRRKQLTEEEEIQVTTKLLRLKREHKLAEVWVDRGLIRVVMPTKANSTAIKYQGEPCKRRLLSWKDAARLAERLEKKGS